MQCDLRVRDKWGRGFENFSSLTPHKYFSEMSPIFCTSEIPLDAIGAHMQEYARNMGIGEKPRILLVGGMRARVKCLSRLHCCVGTSSMV